MNVRVKGLTLPVVVQSDRLQVRCTSLPDDVEFGPFRMEAKIAELESTIPQKLAGTESEVCQGWDPSPECVHGEQGIRQLGASLTKASESALRALNALRALRVL